MPGRIITIERHILETERTYPQATGVFTNLLYDIALAAKVIARETTRAGLVEILGLTRRGQNMMLLIGSYVFYGFWDYRFLSLIIISTVVDYIAGRVIFYARSAGNRRRSQWALLASISTNLKAFWALTYALESRTASTTSP